MYDALTLRGLDDHMCLIYQPSGNRSVIFIIWWRRPITGLTYCNILLFHVELIFSHFAQGP